MKTKKKKKLVGHSLHRKQVWKLVIRFLEESVDGGIYCAKSTEHANPRNIGAWTARSRNKFRCPRAGICIFNKGFY